MYFCLFVSGGSHYVKEQFPPHLTASLERSEVRPGVTVLEEEGEGSVE